MLVLECIASNGLFGFLCFRKGGRFQNPPYILKDFIVAGLLCNKE